MRNILIFLIVVLSAVLVYQLVSRDTQPTANDPAPSDAPNPGQSGGTPEPIDPPSASSQSPKAEPPAPPAASVPMTVLEAGRAFMAENAKKVGVKTTASGIQYEVLREGEAGGPHPRATDEVTVHYRGTLIDGREFDSSHKRGQPATFGLDQVIPGWTEGLQLMTPGARYRFVIPSELAYGPSQRGPLIKPNSTLVFEVELISIAGQ